MAPRRFGDSEHQLVLVGIVDAIDQQANAWPISFSRSEGVERLLKVHKHTRWASGRPTPKV
jgi:hypothetical protein